MSTSDDVFERVVTRIQAIRAEAQAKLDTDQDFRGILRRIKNLEATGDKWRLAEKAAEVKAIKDALGVLGVDATDWDGSVGRPTPTP